MPTPILSVENLAKEFAPPRAQESLKSLFVSSLKKKVKAKTHTALNDINFSILPGEFFGVVGRNGSGKSTLLKMIAGIYQPTRGKIRTYGKLVPFIELGVGFNPELTGRENVYLNGAMLGFSTKEVDKMYDDIVEFAELEDYMGHKLKNYSSGMQVRLAFACATHSEADILVVDEVLAVGDADFQKKCFSYFKSLKNTGTTVILVTHDMGSVIEYCDRAILIEQGKIVTEGNATDVAHAYNELFNPLVNEGASIARWGDERLIFKEVKCSPKTVSSNLENVSIVARVLCNQKLSYTPTIAYAIKDESGQKLIGGKYKTRQLVGLEPGDNKQITFTFASVLGKGNYYVDLSIYVPQEDKYTDCWLDCASIRSNVSGVTGYPIITQQSFDIQ